MINLRRAALATNKHMMVFSNQTHLIFHACHTYMAPAAINFDCHSQILITSVSKLEPHNGWLSFRVNEFITPQTYGEKKTVQVFTMAVALMGL